MILAMAADAVQILVFPLFAEGALSPADDVLDLAVAAVLVQLLGLAHQGSRLHSCPLLRSGGDLLRIAGEMVLRQRGAGNRPLKKAARHS